MNARHRLFTAGALAAAIGIVGAMLNAAPDDAAKKPAENAGQGEKPRMKVRKSDSEWKQELTPLQYSVTREKATERPFTGQYLDNKEAGTYTCVCCGARLFASGTKFESGCGWPSFWDALDKTNVKEQVDRSHGMVRTEILCAVCGAHLGHVFTDGPPPTHKRYCINSASLNFTPADAEPAGKKP